MKIGIDIVSIARIERVYKRHGEHFLSHFLSPSEMDILRARGLRASSIAGFWASKEACAKALGTGISKELSFLDICISYTPANAPLMTLTPEKLAYFGITSFSLSISHDGGFAIAAVICH